MLSSTDALGDKSSWPTAPVDKVAEVSSLLSLPLSRPRCGALSPVAARAGEALPLEFRAPLDDLTDGGRGGDELERLDLAPEEGVSEEVEVAVL